MSTTPAVEITDLVMRYGDKVAVDGLSISVQAGTITAVLGPNGAGKTTTLETCEGFRRPHRGTVRVLGLDPDTQHRELAPRLGVMLQSGGAWSGARPAEMLHHLAALHADPLDPAMLMDLLDLHECVRTPWRRLSGGQQQRLSLAMALIGRPELLFVDEPTAGMDPAIRRATWQLLRRLRADGVTIVLTTHYLDEAEQLADQVHVIDHGRLIASGTPQELTHGGREATIRLVLTQPFPVGAPEQLRADLGRQASVQAVGPQSLVITGPAEPQTLGLVSAWCHTHQVVPESLVMGRRSLEDVFLEVTGRDYAAQETR